MYFGDYNSIFSHLLLLKEIVSLFKGLKDEEVLMSTISLAFHKMLDEVGHH